IDKIPNSKFIKLQSDLLFHYYFTAKAQRSLRLCTFLLPAETRPPRLKAKPMAGRGRKTKKSIPPILGEITLTNIPFYGPVADYFSGTSLKMDNYLTP
ncbi:MAG: hypothetical protein JXA79_11255, partial [Deltaproteobacteria bacterium]|nr:hypothetical protein [Deltaproteobacteria bacterium]